LDVGRIHFHLCIITAYFGNRQVLDSELQLSTGICSVEIAQCQSRQQRQWNDESHCTSDSNWQTARNVCLTGFSFSCKGHHLPGCLSFLILSIFSAL